ncbi:hypothetical protein [Vibrio methylphosphonaticus]|uniref:hypothetical protein n=1 Tax=Vibrio methylphosphonaticus TaxID=2946866 RepID=UPI002029F0B9|nr:hypothetical protein [Vibrio methylphosphonaticus]MCL9775418.1 hypothetical protein [Vibrio methylphosphonaticus]
MQRGKLGPITAGLLAMILLPNSLWGLFLFLCCAGLILLASYLLKNSASSKVQSAEDLAFP